MTERSIGEVDLTKGRWRVRFRVAGVWQAFHFVAEYMARNFASDALEADEIECVEMPVDTRSASRLATEGEVG
jgi:hypothetical protein